MDRQKYGEMMVNQIIEDYKLSDDFKRDAVEYVYRNIINHMNYREGHTADILATSNFSEEAQNEFMNSMAKFKGLKNSLNTLFSQLPATLVAGLQYHRETNF